MRNLNDRGELYGDDISGPEGPIHRAGAGAVGGIVPWLGSQQGTVSGRH